MIEEAHNIVGRSTDTATAENHADPKAYATELICRMLAELRALGVGLILIDQLPSQVAPQVIKNTGTKSARPSLTASRTLGATKRALTRNLPCILGSA